MSGAASRGDRRRRVLNDEVLSASREYANYDGKEAEASRPGRRFALAPGDLSESLVTKVFPRSHWFTVAVIAMLALAAGLLVAADFGKFALAELVGQEVLPLVDGRSSESAATWFVATLLSASALVCACVLVVRCCRSDDFKGSYRCWTLASFGCIALSALHVTKVHLIAAAIAVNLTGFALLDGALWWLAPIAIVGGWMVWRMFRELSESRVSISLFTLATTAVIAAIAMSLSGVDALPASLAMLPRALDVLAPVLLLASLLAYTRHLASQVLGGATVKRLKVVAETTGRQPKQSAKAATASSSSSTDQKSVAAEIKPVTEKATNSVKWTDGSDGSDGGEHDDDESSDSRKLSKADKKRLRRAQQQNRAA